MKSILVIFLIATVSHTLGAKLQSGTLKLIIKTYIDDLIASSQVIDQILQNKLLSLSDHVISHPALSQQHLYVGNRAPNLPPDYLQQLLGNQTIDKRNSALVKRQHPKLGNPEQLQKVLLAGQPKPPPEHFPSDEICSTNRQWEQINSTHDFYDNDVEVVHEEGLQQFIYTYRCASNKKECMGISALYHSECTERHGWVYMYYRRVGEDIAKWGYVAAPHHCACKIQPRLGPITSAEQSNR